MLDSAILGGAADSKMIMIIIFAILMVIFLALFIAFLMLYLKTTGALYKNKDGYDATAHTYTPTGDNAKTMHFYYVEE